ncbi:MAG TPA: transglycosylase SLT domain-containing protein [Methylovorus sp.]|jgi:soluble lytic murein transglycosylase-like protein|nr:transglycosylase SLT domain-containing protein [Methylovorus sp.]
MGKLPIIVVWILAFVSLPGGIALGAESVAPSSLAQQASSMDEILANEPPVIRQMLQDASRLESGMDEVEGEWQAARLYCQASRMGSAEAQYRLGMLYAFGKGVPQSQALGASLFTLASNQGHVQAQRMLETIALTSSELPPCVLADVAPDKAPLDSYAGSDAARIEQHIASLPPNKRWLVGLVDTLARWHHVDPKLILSIIAVESNFKLSARSSKEAMGLMQLIPDTAERFNVRNAYDASQNIRGGIAYMRWLLAYFKGDVRLAVAGYNAGERAVERYRGVPPYAETRAYVKRVMTLYPRLYHPYDERVVDPTRVIMKQG